MTAGVADWRAGTSSALGSRPVHRSPSRRQVNQRDRLGPGLVAQSDGPQGADPSNVGLLRTRLCRTASALEVTMPQSYGHR